MDTKHDKVAISLMKRDRSLKSFVEDIDERIFPIKYRRGKALRRMIKNASKKMAFFNKMWENAEEGSVFTDGWIFWSSATYHLKCMAVYGRRVARKPILTENEDGIGDYWRCDKIRQ